jgi:hypothetical protein
MMMSTEEWAKDLRQRQDAERRQSAQDLTVIKDLQESVWQAVRQELNAGIEGYGLPRYGRYERIPAGQTWWIKIVTDTPNRNTPLRELKAMHKSLEREIVFSYAVLRAAGFSVKIGTLHRGGVGLIIDGSEISVADIAQRALAPFLDNA